MRNPPNGFFKAKSISFLKNGTFHFGMTIGFVNSSLTFCCRSLKYQFDEAGEKDIFKLDNTDEGAAIFTT